MIIGKGKKGGVHIPIFNPSSQNFGEKHLFHFLFDLETTWGTQVHSLWGTRYLLVLIAPSSKRALSPHNERRAMVHHRAGVQDSSLQGASTYDGESICMEERKKAKVNAWDALATEIRSNTVNWQRSLGEKMFGATIPEKVRGLKTIPTGLGGVVEPVRKKRCLRSVQHRVTFHSFETHQHIISVDFSASRFLTDV